MLVASAYVPFPLSHGGAVRIHNLTARAAADWDQILVAFTETDAPPAAELLDRFVEVVLVRRTGTHAAPSTGRPEVVEHFASASFRAALRDTVRKWRPAIAQLEFTQMAQYAADCAPASAVLVEHDITFDLYQQLCRIGDDWDLRHELKLWRRFETAAWREMDCVVTMSEKDRALVTGARAAALPNGVDLDRFRSGGRRAGSRAGCCSWGRSPTCPTSWPSVSFSTRCGHCCGTSGCTSSPARGTNTSSTTTVPR